MGSEMCIRDSVQPDQAPNDNPRSTAVSETEVFCLPGTEPIGVSPCLLYTSDAADERSSVDLGGRRIIKKKISKDTSDDR